MPCKSKRKTKKSISIYKVVFRVYNIPTISEICYSHQKAIGLAKRVVKKLGGSAVIYLHVKHKSKFKDFWYDWKKISKYTYSKKSKKFKKVI